MESFNTLVLDKQEKKHVTASLAFAGFAPNPAMFAEKRSFLEFGY